MFISHGATVAPSVSYLRHLIRRPGQHPVLHQSEITEWRDYSGFDDFITDFWATATYPSPQSHKYETYSFLPTLVDLSVDRNGRHGHWREGAYAADELTLFVADLDNANPVTDMVSFDDVRDKLRSQ